MTVSSDFNENKKTFATRAKEAVRDGSAIALGAFGAFQVWSLCEDQVQYTHHNIVPFLAVNTIAAVGFLSVQDIGYRVIRSGMGKVLGVPVEPKP
ncbi:MAG: hypothetical protein WCD70_15665 [Alphaproteobacteria bacterium]